MKRKIGLVLFLMVALVCIFALAVNAECTSDHDGKWSIEFGKEGYLGEISASYTCSTCNQTAKETIKPLFETLGYSYGESGITQQYAVNRVALARYEELTGEKIKFGVVAATKNNIDKNPLDKNGVPVNDKVKAMDFTSTKYDLFDIMVNAIPKEHRESTEIICCAYIIAGGQITYIENGVEKIDARALSHAQVVERVDGNEQEVPEIDEYRFVDGVKYRRMSLEDLQLTKYAYWYSTVADGTHTKIQIGTSSTHLKYFATRRFTKSEIPNGTIISTSDGWYYRPEGWVDDKTNSTNARPGEIKTSTVVVDDSWWGSFNTRAFNITQGKSIAESVTAEDIYNKFMMLVPVATNDVGFVPPTEGEDVTPETPTPENPNPETPTPENPNPETPNPENPPIVEGKQNWDDDGVLKILCIGNSFSVDSMEYVYQVAKAAGVKDVVLGNLYIGGCSLATHLSNATNDSSAYTYYTNTSGSWSSKGGQKISTTVKSDDWDFISVQQASGYSGVSDSYDDLDALLDIVEPMNPSARLVWHMTWAYKTGSGHQDFGKYDKNQMTMYNAILNAVQTKVLTENRIEIVIPAGTAIQNARTSYYGDNFTRDGYHLNDFGRYIGSLTFVKALTGLSIDNIDYKLSSMTDNNRLLAIDAVNNAVLTPYSITASKYAEEPKIEVPDVPSGDDFTVPDGYRLLTLEEMGWQSCSYWNTKNYSHNEGDSFHQKYYSTKNSFTRNEIPVGSIILLKQGENWQYRPDGWGGSGSRPGNVSVDQVVVNESWWSGYTTRGFNISKTTGAAINGYTPEEIYEVLRILVPVKDEAATESTVTSDMCVSEVTIIDGREYRALTASAMGLTPFSYYWSEKGEGLYLDDQEMAKKFFATKELDKSVLVDGAVIWVDSGWQYRPEGWDYTGSRPNNVSEEYVTVDANWWGSYSKRAFNISMTDLPALAPLGYDTVEEIYEIFKIYIPVDQIAE